MKNESKIRRLLGNDYHLFVSYDNDEVKWLLFKNYDNPKVYFSKDNEAIMSSETHTEEELLKYAKEHHNINEHCIMNSTRCIMLIITLILATVNIFLHDVVLRTIILSVNTVFMIEIIISELVYNHNHNVKMRILNEHIIRSMKELEDKTNDNE